MVTKNEKPLIGNVKKELDVTHKDEILEDCWRKRSFNVSKCRACLRRIVIKKHFQLKVKILNGLMPAYKKMKMCSPFHDDMCLRCGI